MVDCKRQCQLQIVQSKTKFTQFLKREKNNSIMCSLWLVICTVMSSATSQTFTSYEYYEWSGDTLECDDYLNCIINCYGPTACDRVTIIGPYQATLTINCNSLFAGFNDFGQACPHITVYAQNSTQLYINAYNADHEFYTSTIYTPLSNIQTQTSQTNTFITCGIVGQYNVDTETILSCGEGHNIYAQNGWESVQWRYSDNSYWSLTEMDDRYPVTMYCGTDYLYSCRGWDVEGIYYRCSDRTSQCDYDRSLPSTTDSTG